MVIMSNSNKRKTDMSATETDGDSAAHARHAGASYADPSKWVQQAEAFARRGPVKAVASAVGAGFLMNLLPIRAILGALIAIVFVLARPLLLFLGLLKAWEMCPCKKEPKV